MAARWGKLLAVCVLVLVYVAACSAGRSEEDVLRLIDEPHKASAPSAARKASWHQALPGEDANGNVEMAVDYSDEADALDPEFEQEQPQVMTYSTYYPPTQQQQMPREHMRGKPCHQRHHQQVQRGAQAAHNAVTAAAAAADAADADTLVTAASHAWKRAQEIAERLAAADAEETAELVAELDKVLDSIAAAEQAADSVIDHRWDHFDGIIGGVKWSELVADWINPARRYERSSSSSGSSSSSSADDNSFDSSSEDSSSSSDEADDADDNSYAGFTLDDRDAEYEEGLLPGHVVTPAHNRPAKAAATAGRVSDDNDFGLFILAEDNAANNMALFGVHSPSEVAAAAAAAAPSVHYDTGLSWSGLLEWLAAAPFQTVDPQGAATGLLVACTLFVFLAFLVSVADLRCAVHAAPAAAAAAATAAGSSSGGTDGSPSSSGNKQLPAGPGPLRTRKSAFGQGCGSVAAAAAAAAAAASAAVASGCGAMQGAGESMSLMECLSRPLLQQQQEEEAEEDLEAPAELVPQPSSGLAPAVQRFYNPLHTQRSGAYQQLPGTAE